MTVAYLFLVCNKLSCLFKFNFTCALFTGNQFEFNPFCSLKFPSKVSAMSYKNVVINKKFFHEFQVQLKIEQILICRDVAFEFLRKSWSVFSFHFNRHENHVNGMFSSYKILYILEMACSKNAPFLLTSSVTRDYFEIKFLIWFQKLNFIEFVHVVVNLFQKKCSEFLNEIENRQFIKWLLIF